MLYFQSTIRLCRNFFKYDRLMAVVSIR